MQAFRKWSIRHKLKAILAVTACIAAITVAVSIAVFDLAALRRSMARDLTTLADVLAQNSTAALAFHDPRAGADVLRALNADPSVTTAAIYTKDGEAFAEYKRAGVRVTLPMAPERETIRFEPGQLVIYRAINLDGDPIGTIYLQTDLQRLNAKVREYVLVVSATIVCSLCLALFLAPRLQRPISRPLLELVRTTESIAKATDYSIRATRSSEDEFGKLVSAFNGMLGQIQKRDSELRDHRQHLEEEVAVRTSELVAANAQIKSAEEKYRAIVEDAVVGIFQLTSEGCPLSVNRALAEMHGYDSPDSYLKGVENVFSQLFVEPAVAAEWKNTLDADGVLRGGEAEVYRRDGTRKWVLANIRVVRTHNSDEVQYEGTVEDITDRKAAEQKVRFLAYYDALTGLPNRTLLQDRLSKALGFARRHNNKVALLFLDLDRFKVINDSLGHSVGDLLLQKAAERLTTQAREQDTVARVGGDEFVIVLTSVNASSDAALVATRIVTEMTAEFAVQGHLLGVTCSLGISIYPDHGDDAETLIKNADAAMYSAKERGRNNFQFFTDEMNVEAVERLQLENSLRVALERQELYLVFQPQMHLDSGRMVGMEALLRWQHPELGLVPPDKFIRVAENTGAIVPIGEWVLRTACAQVRSWQDQGLPVVPIAVNVSAVQFRQEGFRSMVREVLKQTGISPHLLELELTETLLLTNADVMFPVLDELKRLGVRLSIDDFGTGYSSLSYLRQLPVSKLKIDRSFIRDVATNSDDAAITGSIINMAKSLSLKVIAEGVENEAQLAFLRAHRCDEIQGYYFSRPTGADAVAVRLLMQSEYPSLEQHGFSRYAARAT